MALFDRPPPDRAASRLPPPPPIAPPSAGRRPRPTAPPSAGRPPARSPCSWRCSGSRRRACSASSPHGPAWVRRARSWASRSPPARPGVVAAGFAAWALARVGLDAVRAPAAAWRWTAGRVPAEGFLAASPGASAGRLTTQARDRRCHRPARRPADALPDRRWTPAAPCAGGAGPAPALTGVPAACRAAHPSSSRDFGLLPRADRLAARSRDPPPTGRLAPRGSVGVDRPSPRAAGPARPRARRRLPGSPRTPR